MPDDSVLPEPLDLGDDEGVPAELVELYEVLEWKNAVADAEGVELPHPDIGVPPPNDPGEAHSTPLVSRDGWGARAAVCRSTNIAPEGITLHYGGPSPWGSGVDRSSAARFLATADHNRCPTIMRAYQRFHLDTRGWCDFAYNSGACPHGWRFEGRGPGVRSGAQGTNEGNRRSYATVILTGAGDPMTDPAKLACLDEADRFRARLRWGHRDWKPTSCPGDPAYRWKLDGFPRPSVPQPPKPPPKPPQPQPTGVVKVNVRVLRRGMKGGDVRSLQALLNAKASQGLVVDGDFGPRTDTAVRNVQRFFRLTVDGVCGAKTWPTLFL